MNEKERSKDEIVKKILEIEKSEQELKKRKHLLQKQKPWYTSASNIIGLLTIIITISIAIFSFIANEERLEMECLYSQAEPFTNISPNISNKVTVLFEGSSTDNIGRVRFKLSNNGTRAIKKSDFSDGPIQFKLNGTLEGTESDSLGYVPLLLDVVKLQNANQRNDIIEIKSTNEKSIFTYLPSLLNPGDEVELEALVSNITDLSVGIEGNIADGSFIASKQYEQRTKSTYLLLGDSIIRLLGAKWIAITLLIVFFLLSLLKSFAAFDSFEHNLVDYTFGTLFISIDLSFLASIISVAMN